MKALALFALLALICVAVPAILAEDAEANVPASGTESYTEEELKAMRAKQEGFEFQTEVSRLMSILINSLYSNKEVFLREAISNAADALDKIRFIGLTDKEALGTGDLADLDIRIKADPENGVLHITDKGIGMTKQELIRNLGTIAKSGTREFIERMQAGADTGSLIGQFGVGFYSYFLVADKITVASKSNNDTKQWVWESEAGTSFTVTEDPKGNTLGRGTRISLHMKEDAKHLLEPSALKALIMKYSEFINFPIYVFTTKEVTEEVPIEEEKKEEVPPAEDEKEDSDVIEEDEEEEEPQEEKPKTKKVTKKVSTWDRANTAKPIWTRKPENVTEEEYESFYKSLTKDTAKPMKHIHFTAEGDVDFRALIYIPPKPPANMFVVQTDTSSGIRLYVRRVFITDKVELAPVWLRFLKGVVDSDDLPLNVGRETLQQDKLVDKIRRKLVRKGLAMLQDMAKSEEEKFVKEFWPEYSSALKYGIIDDLDNRDRLAKLLRFPTTHGANLTSLEEYTKRMKKGQDNIYFLGGEAKDQMLKSPLLERLTKRGLEVLLMDDPLDEYLVQHLTKFDHKYELTNIGKDGLKLPGDNETDDDKKLEEEFKELLPWVKETLKGKLEKAVLSKRLASSPSALVVPSWSVSANMERIMKAQALSNQGRSTSTTKKIMELNPRHPIIVELNRRVKESKEDQRATDIVGLLYETAALQSGFGIDEPADFARRINRMLKASLDLDIDAEAVPVEETMLEDKEGKKEDSKESEKEGEKTSEQPKAEEEGSGEDDGPMFEITQVKEDL